MNGNDELDRLHDLLKNCTDEDLHKIVMAIRAEKKNIKEAAQDGKAKDHP